MGLSSDLISQFVKATRDTTKNNNKESTHLGTVVEYDGRLCVQLDGSELLTPVNKTTTANPGDRVSVLIKDHTATVTGNISSPSVGQGDLAQTEGMLRAEIDLIASGSFTDAELAALSARLDELASGNLTLEGRFEANEAFINDLTVNDLLVNGKLTAAEAEIDYIKATKIDTDVLEAEYAKIADLEAVRITANVIQADLGDFRALYADDFKAVNAEITNLKALNGDIENLNSKYADIEFANIGDAAIENFYAKSGIIEDLVVSDGHVTGTLVGVTIKGDIIEGNTIVAEKLVVKGKDGLYYSLNVNGETVEAEQTEYNSLNGSVITAKSVTANKIYVDDLVAFDATIGGFHITDHSLYSGVKESINNGTVGIYMDDDGQFTVGDEYNFIKWYKSPEGEDFILDISLVSAAEERLNGVIETEKAEIIATTQGLISSATETYVTNDEYTEFKQSTESTLQQNSEKIEMNFTTTTQQIGDVDSDVQSKFEELYKYIRFSGETAITIGSGDNAIVLEVDNEKGIIFRKNGAPLGLWNGVDFFTGNVVVEVEERAQFGNFAFVPRTDGSLSFLRVGSPPMVVICQPRDVTVAGGDIWTLKFEVKGYDTTYQWYQLNHDERTWDEFTSDEFKQPTLTNENGKHRAGKYRCIATNKHGHTVVSDTATVVIVSDLAITTQPSDVRVVGGKQVTLSVVAEGYDLQCYYHWQKVNDDGTYSAVSGGNTASITLTLPEVTEATKYRYRCIVSDNLGAVVKSDIATVTVITDGGLQIITQPQDISVPAYGTGTLSVEAYGDGLTYQWQYNTSTSGGEPTNWANATDTGNKSNTLTITAGSTGPIYRRCVVKDAYGDSVISRVAKINITSSSGGGNTGGDTGDTGDTNIRIITEPLDVSLYPGDTATMTIEAEGEGLTYKWEHDGGSGWTTITDASASTKTLEISVSSTATPGKVLYRRCIVTNASGASATSRTASITILDPNGGSGAALRIVTEPQDMTLNPGESGTLSVVAEGSGLTYQWQSPSGTDTWTNLSGATQSTHKVTVASSATGGSLYRRCVITDSSGASVISRTVTITIPNQGSGGSDSTTLRIVTEPKDQYVPRGSSATLTIEAQGVGLTYQWQVSNYDSTTGTTVWSDISGATSSSHVVSIGSGTGAAIKVYRRCIVTDSTGASVTSRTVTINVPASV